MFCRPQFSAAEDGLNILLGMCRSGDYQAFADLEEDFYALTFLKDFPS